MMPVSAGPRQRRQKKWSEFKRRKRGHKEFGCDQVLAAEPSSPKERTAGGGASVFRSAAVYCRERGGGFHAASYFPEELHGYLNRPTVICGFYNLMALLITTLRGGAVAARQVNKLLDFFTGRCYFIVMREILHTVCTQFAHKERQNLQNSAIKRNHPKQQRQRGKPGCFCCKS